MIDARAVARTIEELWFNGAEPTEKLCYPIIQQAITEAVDAAVAQKDKRIAELETELKSRVDLVRRFGGSP